MPLLPGYNATQAIENTSQRNEHFQSSSKHTLSVGPHAIMRLKLPGKMIELKQLHYKNNSKRIVLCREAVRRPQRRAQLAQQRRRRVHGLVLVLVAVEDRPLLTRLRMIVELSRVHLLPAHPHPRPPTPCTDTKTHRYPAPVKHRIMSMRTRSQIAALTQV